MSKFSFNLIDEKWIPVVPDASVSLRDIFTNPKLGFLGGNARQKIALLKFFQAIAQAACTPPNVREWKNLGSDGVASACVSYLEKWYDRFFLYGERPFLQMPVSAARAEPIGSLLPEVALGNNPRLTHIQCGRDLDDGDKALILLTEMSMCLGGKRGDKSLSLAKDYEKRSAPYGPGTGFGGCLHSFLTGSSIIETIWLNLFTEDMISLLPNLPQGLGTPPWEEMPQTEICPVARRLQESLQGRLVPMARFCLLEGESVHFTEGIRHKDNKDGLWDPSAAARADGKTYKMLWVDPEKKPWRSLSSLLSFLAVKKPEQYNCMQLELTIPRLNIAGIEKFGIWSGGLQLSNNSGQQYVTGGNDLLESDIQLYKDVIDGDLWFTRFSQEMKWLEKLETILKACVSGYFKEQNANGSDAAKKAAGLYWEKAEGLFQKLILACLGEESLPQLKQDFKNIILECYDTACPQDSPRQLSAWASNIPKIAVPSSDEVSNG